MAARAIWKGIIRLGTAKVPVKLYSAVTDRTVHFRLLHKTDKQPVRQKLISSESAEPVEYSDVRKAFPIDRGHMVVFEAEELEKLKPKESRDIEITRFLDPEHALRLSEWIVRNTAPPESSFRASIAANWSPRIRSRWVILSFRESRCRMVC